MVTMHREARISASDVIVERVPPRARPASPGIRAVRAAVADRPVVPGRLTLSLRPAANAPDLAVSAGDVTHLRY